jgi:hypothetical protein
MRAIGWVLFVIGLMALVSLLVGMAEDVVGVVGGRAIAIGSSDADAFVIGLPFAVGILATGWIIAHARSN